MRKIELNTSAFLASKNEKKFVILGSQQASQQPYVDKNILPKISRETKDSIPGFWGTLGFSDSKTIDWSGHLEISSDGNDSFKGVVNDEVELIKKCFPKIMDEPTKVIERFISFEHIDFSFSDMFSLDEIPKLRLELMLDNNEGAVVFYQSDKDNDESSIEYIQPQATSNNNVNGRDRLQYLFEVIPQYQLEPIASIPGQFALTTTKEPKPFIIKIITFKRSFDSQNKSTSSNSKEIILEAKGAINKLIYKGKLHRDHRLLIFNRKKNDFFEAEIGDIDSTKKTLFLMHGTFSTTEGSFDDLYGKKGKWLKQLTNNKQASYYSQIIAFDHPTLFFGAEGNINELFNCFDEVGIKSFAKEVDFIGTSQGGLLIQYLANLKTDRIRVGKAALVASANGVGYLTTGQYVAKFLSVLKYMFKVTGMQAQAFISSLAQHSAEFLLEQPGLQIMTPDDDKLKAIMNNVPYRKETIYLPIIDDYDESLIDEEKRRFFRFIKRMGARGVDAIAKTMLGKENDWVVGTKNQFIVPADYCYIHNYNPAKYRDHIIKAIHGTCINKPKAQDRIELFMFKKAFELSDIPPSVDRFDGHCHIFGREIITGRILFLLTQELLSYREAKNSDAKIALIPKLDKNEDISEDISNVKQTETGSVAMNIIKYFAFNKNSYQVLDDLEEEYYNLKSNVYRYIPLMFDLEMTFRNKYFDSNDDDQINSSEKSFIGLLTGYLDDIDKLIKRFETTNKLVFNGSLIENEESVKMLKFIKKSIKVLGVLSPKLKSNTKTGYQKQFDELKALKNRYGNNMFPFLAVDPRRENMAQLILDNVGKGKPFYGIKLYAPNGYSPTDPNLYDDTKRFIDGKCLYSYCVENKIPIMAHCSNAGFSTFVMDLEVYGDVIIDGKIKFYEQPTKITFNHNIFNGGFAAAVRERAETLNHPKLWEKVLTKHNNLQICLAHFGGESDAWRSDIAGLMARFPKLYTDLSCMTKAERLKTIKTEYFNEDNTIVNRIMYGSDFYLNMLDKITFEDYYKHFRSVFSEAQLKNMNLTVPEKFLGI